MGKVDTALRFTVWSHPSRAPWPRVGGWTLLAAPFVGSACATATGSWPWGALAAMLVAGLGPLIGWRRARPTPAGRVVLDSEGLWRDDLLLAATDRPLGLGVLIERDGQGARSARLAVTTPGLLRCLPIRLRPHDDAHRLARHVRPVMVAAGALGQPAAALDFDDALALIDALVARSPRSALQLFATDARGTAIELSPDGLRIADQQIDLASPFAWRAFVFYETTGRVVSAFQGAWVRPLDEHATTTEPAFVGGHLFVAALPGDAERRDPVLDGRLLDHVPPEALHAVDAMLFPSLRDALARARAGHCLETREPSRPDWQQHTR